MGRVSRKALPFQRIIVMLKYYNYDIVFQEVPDEVTLAVNLTNCPNRCQGCHSPHLREDIGTLLDEAEIGKLIAQYDKCITCFCFMGGDAEKAEVERLARFIRYNYKLKTAWYSGRDDLPDDAMSFDYVKLGPYIPEFGGLTSRQTNQRFYRNNNGTLIDITAEYWKKQL